MKQIHSLVEYGFRRAIITLAAVVCTLLPATSVLFINIAINDIRGNLGITLDKATWAITAYTLAGIMIMPFNSRLYQRLGRRNYFTIAILLFTVASFFCGNATGLYELVIFRFLQGLGGGAMLVLSQAILAESWPTEKRVVSQAFFLLGLMLAPALMPLGGHIVDYYSWPFIFFINIPIGFIAALLIFLTVRNESAQEITDLRSTLLLTTGIVALYFASLSVQAESWLNAIVLFITGLAGVVLYIRRMSLFSSRDLSTGLILTFIVSLAIAGSSVMSIPVPGIRIPQPNISLWWAIKILIPIIAIVVAIIEKGKIPVKYLVAAGLLLFAVYCFLAYAIVSADTHIIDTFWLLLINNVAVVLLSVSVVTLTLSKLEDVKFGKGAALYNIMRQLGMAFGFALLSMHAHNKSEMKRMDIAKLAETMDPKVKQNIARIMAEKGMDTSMIDYKVHAFMQVSNGPVAVKYSPYGFILVVGSVCVVGMLVISFVRGGN